MKVNLSFLITDGKNLLLTSSQNLPPTIPCEKSIGDTAVSFLKDVFSIGDEWLLSLKWVGGIEKDETLFIFYGLLVPESFSLNAEFYWESIHTLSSIIEDQMFYNCLMSSLNSI